MWKALKCWELIQIRVIFKELYGLIWGEKNPQAGKIPRNGQTNFNLNFGVPGLPLVSFHTFLPADSVLSHLFVFVSAIT